MRAIQWLCFITLFAVMFCFAVLTANGQALRGDVLGLRPTSMPATCNTGDLRIDSADSYRLKVCEGNIWQTTTANDNVMTALGDIIVGGASGVQTRLGIGTLSHVLQVSPSGVPAYGFITDGNVDASAGIVDTKLATISTSGKVANSATTATDANFADSIVARDGSGDFVASTIFAALSGNASTATALASNPSDCASDTYANAIAASGNLTCATVTNAGLAGSIAASKLVGTDIATVGTVTSGTWSATAIGPTKGGTGLTSYTTGDSIYATGSNTLGKVGIGSSGQVWAVTGASSLGWISATPVLAVTTKSADYTATTADEVIIYTCSTSRTLTLYTAVGNTGKRLYVKRADSTASTACTLDGNSSETIDGSATIALDFQNEAVTLVSDGTNWQVIEWDIPQKEYTISVSGTNWTTSRSRAVITKTRNATPVWYASLNVSGTLSASTANIVLTFTGLSFATGGINNRQSIYASDDAFGFATSNPFAVGATWNVNFAGVTNACTAGAMLELASKPTIAL